MIHSRRKLFRKYCENQFYIHSFFVPAFIMFIVFLILQVHPLGSGKNMVLTVDCYHQYAPFLVELRNKILSGESLFFSWNVGMGTNFWAVFANYVGSPLNILALLFPPKYVGDCVAFLAILRVGFTGLFMSILLKEFDKKRKDLMLVGFSSAYALCGWAASYFWNIMWHDAVMLLPLIVYGLIRMMRDKKPLLYCISLAVCLISNFYSGYFVCLFLVFYAPILYVHITEKVNFKNFWSAVWRFAVYSGIAGALSAFLTLSTYITLQKSSATGGEFPKEWTVMNDLFDFISRFFVASNPNIRDGMANVYCGIFVAMLVPLFFLCRKIRLREKVAYGIGLLIMYISLSSRMMTFIWHGFHFPNQIPFRQAFLISFLVVIMGYRALRNLKSFTKTELTVPCLSMLAYLILYEKIGEGQEGYIAMGCSLLFLLIYTGLIRMIGNARKSSMFQQISLFAVIFFELFASTGATVGLVAAHEGFTGWDFYGSHFDEVQTLMENSEAQCEYGFERSEIYPAYICNQPALYNMKGISIFTSTARESFVKFVRNLGFHNNGINSMRNFGLTEVTGTLFGVRNLYDLKDNSPVPSCFERVNEGDGSPIRQFVNRDALALGYMVDDSVLDFHMEQTSVPFLSTNDFVKSLGITGDVYEPMELSFNSIEDVKEAGGAYRTGYKFSFEKNTATLMFTINDLKPGDHVYLYCYSSKAPNVTINDQKKHSSEGHETKIGARTYQMIDLGYLQAGYNKLVTLKFNDKDLNGNLWVQCARVNETAYKEMCDVLGDEQMKVLSYDSTHVDATVNAKKDGTLLLTIPVDESWEAEVDGMPATLEAVDDAFMGIRLKAGTHSIKLTYHPSKFKLCCLISIAALCALIFLTVVRKVREHFALKRRFGAEAAIASEESDDAGIENAETEETRTSHTQEDVARIPESQEVRPEKEEPAQENQPSEESREDEEEA